MKDICASISPDYTYIFDGKRARGPRRLNDEQMAEDLLPSTGRMLILLRWHKVYFLKVHFIKLDELCLIDNLVP